MVLLEPPSERIGGALGPVWIHRVLVGRGATVTTQMAGTRPSAGPAMTIKRTISFVRHFDPLTRAEEIGDRLMVDYQTLT
jgi:hypothetical protein